jgi:hypothetical protein
MNSKLFLMAMAFVAAFGIVAAAMFSPTIAAPVFAQNMTANATGPSNMTTFEENATASEMGTSVANMSG